jgi:cell division protein FtsN
MPRLTTRDYKRTSRSSGASRLREFALGVLVGAVLASVAFLIAGAHARHRAAAAASTRTGSANTAPHAPAADVAGSSAAAGAATAAAAMQATPQRPGTPTPQYDFYRMLPRLNVPVPHEDVHSSRPPPPAAPAVNATAHDAGDGPSYVLQVGSYRSSAEADQVRARLARAGIAAQVERVAEGSGTWNRVRIGPLSDAKLAKVRQQLRVAKMHALVIRAAR